MKKKKNLQPWIDAFLVLRQLKNQGWLDLHEKNHEAFITLPALHAITKGDLPQQQKPEHIRTTMKLILAYAASLSAIGQEYITRPFAIHVVRDEGKNEPIYTALLSYKRKWWWPFTKSEHIEIITY